MTDLHFKSVLSMDEIDNNFRNVDIFSGIMVGLEEVLAHAKRSDASENIVKSVYTQEDHLSLDKPEDEH